MPAILPNDTLPRKIANTAVYVHGALQKADELAAFFEYAIERKPRSVLEIGCDAGGMLWAFSKIPTVERVYGVTLEGGPYSTGRPLVTHGAEVIIGDSHTAETVNRVTRMIQAGEDWPPFVNVDMVFIDGDHTYDGCLQDFVEYAVFVRPGGMIVLQDICEHPGLPDVAVHRVWAEQSRYASMVLGQEVREFIGADRTWGGIGVIVTR